MKTTRQSTWQATLRTTILMASLSGLLVAIGFFIGGAGSALLFLGIALLINLGSFFFSDKIALKMSKAQPLEREANPKLYQMVEELAQRAELPMPKLYLIPSAQANAFATGRGPKHSSVAVTQGLTEQLSTDEIRGVIAHELAHIEHRDILIQSVAAAIGAAITYLGYMFLWFRNDNGPIGLIASLAMWLLAPIAASIIQMAISRQREYAADAGGAKICGNPESLASALLRLEQSATARPMHVNNAAESMYIVKPFSAKGIGGLFSTHPPIEERVKRLRQMRPSL